MASKIISCLLISLEVKEERSSLETPADQSFSLFFSENKRKEKRREEKRKKGGRERKEKPSSGLMSFSLPQELEAGGILNFGFQIAPGEEGE